MKLVGFVSFGAALFGFAVVAVMYCMWALATKKVLEAYHYDKCWMAWVPLANYYALADVVSKDQEKIKIVGSFEVPVTVFKFWWVIIFIGGMIPRIGRLLVFVVTVLALGTNFAKIFAFYDCKTEEEVKAFSYICGAVPIIAAIKILSTSPAVVE